MKKIKKIYSCKCWSVLLLVITVTLNWSVEVDDSLRLYRHDLAPSQTSQKRNRGKLSLSLYIY